MAQTFEEKVRSMSAKEIIMAMVEGLKNPAVEVNMNEFGDFDGVCVGCAATNAVCKISGVVFDATNIWEGKRYLAVGTTYEFLDVFERAIDSLRTGSVFRYNKYASRSGFAMIKPTYKSLPRIMNWNYQDPEVLDAYIELANAQ